MITTSSDGSTQEASTTHGTTSQDWHSSQQTAITRRLCASALLMGAEFRRTVLDRLRQRHKALAPEIDVDTHLLARVCHYLEHDRPRIIQGVYRSVGLFFLVGVAFLVLVILVTDSPALGLVAYLVGAIPVADVIIRRLRSQNDETLLSHFNVARYNPDAVRRAFNTTLPPEIVTGIARPDQNLVVYSGFTPFIGAGYSLGGWSFVMNVLAGKEDMTGSRLIPEPFAINELYAHFDESLRSLDLEELSIHDALYVKGTEVRDDPVVMAGRYERPRQHADEAVLQRYIVGTDPRIRYYKWIRIRDASESMVVSFFLRCALRGTNLFVEINRFLMTPLIDNYKQVDQHRWDKSPKTIMEQIGEWVNIALARLFGALAGPLITLSAYAALLTEPIARYFRRRRERAEEEQAREAIDDNPFYDFGAAQSIRGGASSRNYEHYFQKLDEEMYVKIIDRSILDVIFAFLDAHNIDTSSIRDQRTHILNSGVIIQGGDLQADVLAVGQGASAAQNNTQSERSQSA
ncbi:MAG: hypothetical protein ACOCXZ_02760 [Chloroflexota bacterium]